MPSCSRPAVTTSDPSPTATTSSPSGPAAPTIASTLPSLQEELATTGRDKAVAAMTHFRPLCDADGYPLVGNLARKAPDYQVSAFCEEVRKAEKLGKKS